MIRSWSPVLCRRYYLKISFAFGQVMQTLRVRSLSAWVGLALLVAASGATAQSNLQSSDAGRLADEEPITPIPTKTMAR